MAPQNSERPAPVCTGNGPLKADQLDSAISLDSATAPSFVQRRFRAWCRVLEAIADQREALEHRIWREDPEDVQLEADCQVLCELMLALADFLATRRSI